MEQWLLWVSVSLSRWVAKPEYIILFVTEMPRIFKKLFPSTTTNFQQLSAF
jgi:hypothetical protein